MNAHAKPDNAAILKALRNPKYAPSESASQLALKLLELIQRDEIGLVFNDPDDCDRDYSDSALMELLLVLIRCDRKFLINDVLEESISLYYPMQKIMEQHPDYARKVKEWEDEQADFERRTGFKSEADEHNHFFEQGR